MDPGKHSAITFKDHSLSNQKGFLLKKINKEVVSISSTDSKNKKASGRDSSGRGGKNQSYVVRGHGNRFEPYEEYPGSLSRIHVGYGGTFGGPSF